MAVLVTAIHAFRGTPGTSPGVTNEGSERTGNRFGGAGCINLSQPFAIATSPTRARGGRTN